jgi:hypothetical protein
LLVVVEVVNIILVVVEQVACLPAQQKRYQHKHTQSLLVLGEMD